MKTFAILFLSLVLSQNPDSRGFIVSVGDQSPDWSLTFTDGTVTDLTSLKGKVILLQFTASWCSVCRKEMPHIEKDIWQKFKDQGLVVIGVDRDEPKDIVEAFSQEMKITYPLALDPGADVFSLFAYKESGVTRNVLINQEGRIVFLTRLFDMDEFNELIQKINSLLHTDSIQPQE